MVGPSGQPLTLRQLEVLRAILRFRRERGLSPTFQELGDLLGTNRVTAYGHVNSLVRKGFLESIGRGASRSILPTVLAEQYEQDHTSPSPEQPSLNLVGRIAAGAPIEAIEDPQPLTHAELLPSSADHYMLAVEGDSMIDDHIQEGDLVVVRSSSTAENGQTVVAVLEDGTATLKRFYREGERVRLQPANRAMDPIYPEQLQLRGVVVGVLRRYA